MPSQDIGKALILLGVVILVAGIVVLLAPRLPFLGKLPGDLSFHKEGVRVFIPITTCILLSIGLTVVVNVLLRLFK
ncbi:MAG: DUF2905 domain-containing protein [Dehalococcoidia bacterium]|nr:DUF2905 domain-containing protein [Dehalococcoidia bacterium]